MSVCCCSLAGTVACEHCQNRSVTTNEDRSFNLTDGNTSNVSNINAILELQLNASNQIIKELCQEIVELKTKIKIYEEER